MGTSSGPSPITVLGVILVLVVVVLGFVFAIGALYPPSPTTSAVPMNLREQTCPPTTNRTIDGAVYLSCNATLYWSESLAPSAFFAVQHLATVSFERVLFNITGYNTMECPW